MMIMMIIVNGAQIIIIIYERRKNYNYNWKSDCDYNCNRTAIIIVNRIGIVYITILSISLYCIYNYIVYIIILFISLYRFFAKAIYHIGTEILYFQCFVTTDMFLFSKSIIPEDLSTDWRVLKPAGVKRRFKAILKRRKTT